MQKFKTVSSWGTAIYASYEINYTISIAKGLVPKLAPPHAQDAWKFRGESVRVAGLAACCNYF